MHGILRTPPFISTLFKAFLAGRTTCTTLRAVPASTSGDETGKFTDEMFLSSKRFPLTIRGHRKYRREGGTKNRDRVGGKNMASGRGTNSWDREGVVRGNF